MVFKGEIKRKNFIGQVNFNSSAKIERIFGEVPEELRNRG